MKAVLVSAGSGKVAILLNPQPQDRRRVSNPRIHYQGRWYENLTDVVEVGPEDEIAIAWDGPSSVPRLLVYRAVDEIGRWHDDGGAL